MRGWTLFSLATAASCATTGWDLRPETEVIFVTKPSACPTSQNLDPSAGIDFQLPPLFGGEIRELVPTVDPTLDRDDLDNLVPKTSDIPLYYVEKHGMDNYTYTASIEFQTKQPMVALENSACIVDVAWEGSYMKLVFCSQEAFDIASKWPQSGLVIVTNDPDFNKPGERGVYITKGLIADPDTLTIRLLVEPTTWGTVGTTMTIKYGNIQYEDGGPDPITSTTRASSNTAATTSSRTTAVTTTVITSRPTISGTATSLSTGVPQITTAPGSFSSPERPATSSTISLNPSQRSLYEQVLADATFDGPNNATLVLQLRELATAKPNIEVIRCERTGACRDSVDAILAADGLPSDHAIVQAALDAADKAYLQPYAITPDMKVTENFDPVYAPYSGGSTTTPNIPRSTTAKLLSRGYWGLLFSDLKTRLATDFFGSLCEACDQFGSKYDAQELAAAANNLLAPNASKPTPLVKADGAVDIVADVGLLPNTYVVDANSGTRTTCVKCGITVASMVIEGTIVADVATGQVISATLDTTLSQSVDLIFDFKTAGPASLFWYESTLYTKGLAALSIPNILVISPKFVVGLGITYDISKQLNASAGISFGFSNAKIQQQDILNSVAGTPSNWDPSVNITWPSLKEPASIRMAPWLRSTMQTSLQIFGKEIQNATKITQVYTFGIDAQVQGTDAESRIAEPQTVTTDLPNILNHDLIHRQVQPTLTSDNTCPSNGIQLTAVLTCHVESGFDSTVLNGGTQVLLDKSYPFGSRCLTLRSGASNTPSTSSIADPTSTLVSCLRQLPAECTSLSSQSGLILTATRPICQSTLAGYGIGYEDKAGSCFSSVITSASQGKDIVDCLQRSIGCTSSTTTPSGTTTRNTRVTTTTMTTTTTTTRTTTTSRTTTTTTTTTRSTTPSSCPNYPAKIPSCNKITYTGGTTGDVQWSLYYSGANGTAGLSIGATPKVQALAISGAMNLCTAFYQCIDAASKSSSSYTVIHMYKLGAAGDQYICAWGEDVQSAYGTTTGADGRLTPKPFDVPYADVQQAFGLVRCAACQPSLCNSLYTP